MAIVRAGLLCLLACTTACAVQTSGLTIPQTLPVEQRRPGQDLVLVIAPDSDVHERVWTTFRQETQDDFDIAVRLIGDASTPSDIKRAMDALKPRALVLVDNRAVQLFQKIKTRPTPPALVLMTSFLRDVVGPSLSNITGITYEIPGVSIFVRLRAMTGQPFRRIGVVHRPLLSSFIERETALAAREGIEIVAVSTSKRPTPEEVRGALRKLPADRVDALWILNDNALLSKETIVKGWLPELTQSPRLTVVGVESLVQRVDLGSFAMLPSHDDLGVQAADLLYRLADDGWNPAAIPLEDPFAVKSMVQLEVLEQVIEVDESMLGGFDRIYKAVIRGSSEP